MGWKDLLQTNDETTVLPWVGGRSLRSGPRRWSIKGKLPTDHGWYKFSLDGRTATVKEESDPDPEKLIQKVVGYLVGDRIVPDGITIDPDPSKIIESSERVHLIDPGLDRFVRISSARICEDGPLIFNFQEMPLGPEEDVLDAFLNKKSSVDAVSGVSPALDAAFRMEHFRSEEARKAREEAERRRIEEEERLVQEEKRAQTIKQLGSGAGRREMAKIDFDEAARAALAVGGAEFLDARGSYNRHEKVVRFRFNGRRFECTCDKNTLQIIDSGICLTDHATGEKGDTYFTLESFPGVIQEAEDEGKLVVYRRVDDEYPGDY